jgi:hypothetical protein
MKKKTNSQRGIFIVVDAESINTNVHVELDDQIRLIRKIQV